MRACGVPILTRTAWGVVLGIECANGLLTCHMPHATSVPLCSAHSGATKARENCLMCLPISTRLPLFVRPAVDSCGSPMCVAATTSWHGSMVARMLGTPWLRTARSLPSTSCHAGLCTLTQSTSLATVRHTAAALVPGFSLPHECGRPCRVRRGC